MPPILEARGLTKRFKSTQALAGLDLSAERGQVTAILGPNGAGKTTFIRMVATLLRPDEGTLTVAGIDAIAEPDKVRRAIGLAGQSAAVEGAMTGRENLMLVGRLFGHDSRQAKASAEVVLDLMGLNENADRLVRTYSGGMRRKLDLGASLVGAPELLLLDEPTTGLDPRSRRAMWQIVRELVADGVTIFLTTQYLEEADELADRIALLDHGRLIAQGTAEELKRRLPGGHIELTFADAHLLDAARRLLDTGTADPEKLTLQVSSDGSVRAIRDLLARLDENSIDIDEMSVHTPDLDDVFLALTDQPEEVAR
jgi:ABC-2 type transport system ATP-binding protein